MEPAGASVSVLAQASALALVLAWAPVSASALESASASVSVSGLESASGSVSALGTEVAKEKAMTKAWLSVLARGLELSRLTRLH